MLNQYELIFYKMYSRHKHLYTDFFQGVSLVLQIIKQWSGHTKEQ